MYADLGSSLCKQLAPATSAIDLDDSHVEYAKINHTECEQPPTLSEQKPEGIYGYYYACMLLGIMNMLINLFMHAFDYESHDMMYRALICPR